MDTGDNAPPGPVKPPAGAGGAPVFKGRLLRLPVFRYFLLVRLVIASLLLALLVFSASGFVLLAYGIRAYAGAEGLWAAAQKDAVINILQYASTGDNSYYEAFRRDLAIPLADREARLEMDQPRPDHRAVYRAIVRGGNSPADAWVLVLLYHWFHGSAYLAKPITLWRTGDGYIQRLQALGDELHGLISSGRGTPGRIRGLVQSVTALNGKLTLLENAFSSFLGNIARTSARLLLLALLGGCVLTAGVGFFFSRLFQWVLKDRLRHLEEATVRVAGGDLHSRVGGQVADELGSLAAAFNRMTDRLARSQADLTARTAELSLALAEQELIMKTVPDLIYMVDAEKKLVKWNRQLELATGLSGKQLAGLDMTEIFVPGVEPLVAEAFDRAVKTGLIQIEGRIKGPDGSTRIYEWTGAPLRDDQGALLGLTGAGRDVTDRRALEKQLAHEAFHDRLTGLPNRALFFNRLEQARARAERRHTVIGILFADLDRFKNVNDSLGHKAGDQLLAAVANRFKACVRPDDTVARIGGDEFCVLLEEVEPAEVPAVARRLAEALRTPFEIVARKVFISASVGVCIVSPPFNHSSDELLRNADLAMYEAKRQGRSKYVVFDPVMSIRAKEAFDVENDLRRALDLHELRVYYQPLVDMATGRVREVEALVRWEHPTRGLLPAAEFIPVAEETGLIIPIGRWVLQQTCREAKAWPNDGLNTPVTLCVNVSAAEFRDPLFCDDVARLLASTGLPPDRLKLEITESTLMTDGDAVMATMRRMKTLGVQLAVDDFGTAYSSLRYLRHFPVDQVKIDRSFIRNIGANREDAAIVRSVVELAGALSLTVTAEGIETAEAFEKVREIGCNLGQGFYIGRPLSSSDTVSLIQSNSGGPPLFPKESGR